jgi:hypothetical protein
MPNPKTYIVNDQATETAASISRLMSKPWPTLPKQVIRH